MVVFLSSRDSSSISREKSLGSKKTTLNFSSKNGLHVWVKSFDVLELWELLLRTKKLQNLNGFRWCNGVEIVREFCVLLMECDEKLEKIFEDFHQYTRIQLARTALENKSHHLFIGGKKKRKKHKHYWTPIWLYHFVVCQVVAIRLMSECVCLCVFYREKW